MRPVSGADGRDEICVRGGPGGTAVGLESLDAAARQLTRVAEELALMVWRVASVAMDPDLVGGSLLSPVTGARADLLLARSAGPGGLAGEATALLALSAAVVAAAAAYRQAEATATHAVELAQDTVMFVVGGWAPEIVVGVLTLDALGVDVARVLDEIAFDEPAVADLAGGAEGLVLGLRARPLTAPFVLAPSRSDDLGDDQDYERAVRVLVDSAAPWGLLSDRGRVRVGAEPRPRTGARAPGNLADLATDLENLDDGESYAGHVRVIEVPQGDRSAWIVEVSGTQVWDPRPGSSPFDLTTDAHLMAQDATALADGVVRALEQAQAASASASASPQGSASTSSPAASGGPALVDPVMLVGHSLGGIAAAGLASSPRFTQEHAVTHVVTMGSPVGRMPVAAGVQVLSLEHAQDAVPRLDGQPNPDRRSWVTVTRDLDAVGVDRASQAHATALYAETAALVDDSSDPSVVSWRADSAAFFAADTNGRAVVRDFVVERVVP